MMEVYMSNVHEKLARILRTQPEVLLELEQKLNAITGKSGVMEKIIMENEVMINRTLEELGLPETERSAEKVYELLVQRLKQMDTLLYGFLDKPDLFSAREICGKLCDIVFEMTGARRGFFIKKEKLQQMLETFPPQNLLDHFQCQTVTELVEKEGLTTIFCALRFAQDNQWMHDFFAKAYDNLSADDFEERDIEIKILEKKWLDIAEKFTRHKYHNVSHLKELGVIFVVPIDLAPTGETLRLFLLLLHYLNEVPYYSGFFRKLIVDENFVANFQSLLRGDVPEGAVPSGNSIRIVQRYLAKDDPNDPRLTEPHVNPEAEHWYRAGSDFTKLKKYFSENAEWFSGWEELHFVGDLFPSQEGERLISFDLVDLTMSLASQSETKYRYHQQEALWNQIFIEYLGRDRMNQMIEENITKGFIEL